MKREIITITDNGIVTVPGEAKMTISEIADLFGIYYQTAKRHIRSVEKSGVADGDYSMCCTAEGQKVYPEYYGSDMVIAVAFQVQSARTELFRRWVVRRIIASHLPRTIMLSLQKSMLN